MILYLVGCDQGKGRKLLLLPVHRMVIHGACLRRL
jgi:hypothetical protein